MLALCLGTAPVSLANDEAKQLAAKAAALAAEQKAEAAQKAQVQAETKRLTQRIDGLKKNLAFQTNRVAEQTARVETLRFEQSTKAAEVKALQQSLTRELIAFYQAGPDARLNLASQQSGPRLVEYLRFVTSSRRERLEQLQSEQRQLAAAERALAEEKAALQRDITALQDEERRLAASTERQKSMLAKLERSLDSRAAKQRAVEEDRRQLAKLLNDIKPSSAAGLAFAKSRGKLDWPLQGRVLRGFGQKRSDGQSNWTGMVIAAPAGTEVRAVQSGKVAYAGWLLGYGLLLVIEHDNGYATLYGHNQTLVKERGDRVEAGELIGRAGATGSVASNGLFFGVNRQGKPLDPVVWLKKRSG